MREDASNPDRGMSSAARNEEFVRLFSLHHGDIQAYVATLVPHAADADEVFQRTSVTLWQNFDRFNSDGSFVNWACGVARNVLRNYRREFERRHVFLLSDDVLDSVGQLRHKARETLSDRHAVLEDCLDELPASQRELVASCYSGESKIKKVAEQLQRTPNAIYKQLAVIRRLLFECVRGKLAGGGSQT